MQICRVGWIVARSVQYARKLPAVQDHGGESTKGQIISRPVLFARLKDYGPLFTLGQPASSEFWENRAAC